MRLSRTLKLWLAGLILMLAACGRGREIRDSELSLDGALPVAEQADPQGVVRLESRGHGFCVGVLVASDLILTAAHCLDNNSYPDVSVRFPLASGGAQSMVPAETRRVRDDSLLYFPNFDIGWIRLPSNAPEPYKPVQILGNSKHLITDTPVELVGFATFQPCNVAECGLVKLATTLVSSWSSSHLVSLAVVQSHEANPAGRTCPGDSGGPGFVSTAQGRALFGLVAGKDPIFAPDSRNSEHTVCGSRSTTMTRVGDYQTWIEVTSGRRLSVVDPSPAPLSLEFLGVKSAPSTNAETWAEWFLEPNSTERSWESVHKLLEQIVLEFKDEIPAEEIPMIFANEEIAKGWLGRLTTLESLTMGFPAQATPIVDLRPYEVLTSLEELSFLARDYAGLRVLQKLPKLRKLTITGRVNNRQQVRMLWNEIHSSSLAELTVQHFEMEKLRGLTIANFASLKSLNILTPLGSLWTSWLETQDLGTLESLQVHELTCNSETWPQAPLPSLKALTLRSTTGLMESDLACVKWDFLPNLEEFMIQGYRRDGIGIESRLSPRQLGILRHSP